ncbi:hypothetical protein [Streptomyces sp. B6B3]|uniref:hypothetical protein n=1 Tax=Streptomyces sp. B6B3 TaxID=3153570 RepID=UPI00325F9014
MTLFRDLVQGRHLTSHRAFSVQFQRAAEDLAERVGDPRLASLDVSPRQFDRWMGGEIKSLPQPDACRVLEHMLGQPAADLFQRPGSQSVPVSPASPAVAATELPASACGDDPLEIVARARQLTTSNADPPTIAFLRTSLERISGRYEQEGPQGLHGQTADLRTLLHTLLDGHQPPRVRQDLFHLTARASGLLAYMAVNTGHFTLAEAYCVEAQELSRVIGDLHTELWVNGTRSFSLYYAGRYAEADACAAAAVERSPQAAQAIRLLVNGRARALGKLGDRKAADRAIGQALDLTARHDVPAGLTPCMSFQPYGQARTLANAITAHVSLGNADQALRSAEQIDDMIEHSDSAWSRSLVRLDVATALLHQRSPDIEHALRLGKEALGLCGGKPIRSVWQRSRDLHAWARRWPDRAAVREYGDELRLWSSQPAALAMSAAGTR